LSTGLGDVTTVVVGHEDHKKHAPKSVRVYVITVSDSRTEETDTSGRLACELCERFGHTVAGKQIVKDEPAEVARLVRYLVDRKEADAIVTTGGTGVSKRDSTYEAIAGLLDKRLDGFGELFRMLSYQEIGSAAMLSRAVGGLHRGVAVFALPGSSAAVRLGLEKLVLPELGHLVFEQGR
jgi:molybdenum cofactor biosynthesis protein B